MTRLASDDPHRVHAIVALAGAEDEEELAELLGGRVMTPESPRTTFHQIRRQRADLVATMALLDEAATPERVHEGLRDAYDGLSKALYAYDALRVDMIASVTDDPRAGRECSPQPPRTAPARPCSPL